MGDVAALADLLHEASIHHGDFEAVAPPQTGGTGTRPTWTRARRAAAPLRTRSRSANRYMADVKHIVMPA